MLKKVLLVIFALALPLTSLSCKERASSGTPSAQAAIFNYLRQPGKVTYVRYTSYTPPWPTRTEAWIDWENNRVRAWNIQWTDNPTNPSVCTSIRDRNEWHPCLPSLDKIEPGDLARSYALWQPRVPLRASDSELSLLLPKPTASTPAGANANWQPVTLEKSGTTRHERQGDEEVVVTSWKIRSQLDLPCQEGQAPSAHFEYTTLASGEPLSEFITATCGGKTQRYFGILYHEIRFIDRSDLPADFFDASAARRSIIANEMSSATAQLGSAFWFGSQAGGWSLTGVEHGATSAQVTYSRGSGDRAQDVQLTTQLAGFGYVCPSAQPIPNDAYGGSICTLDAGQYRIVWKPPGFEVSLAAESNSSSIGRGELLALGAKLAQWHRKAPGPLLSSDEVSALVADSLELVCPTKLAEIRKTAPASSFRFDRKTDEWIGVFGSFGEYAIPDSKPVAIPTKHRKEVQSTLSHNAAQFADCAAGEQPTPQKGDDQFAVTFIGKDASGFAFQVTGVDSKAEAALSLCLAVNGGGCDLTAPGGMSIRGGPVNLTAIRPMVYRLHIGLAAQALNQTGRWTFALDLGGSRAARIAFDVR